MCGSCENSNLDDDLGDIFASDDSVPARPLPTLREAAQAVGLGHTEKCFKCRGTGQWRPGYPCFACKGKGTKTFKTAPAVRAASREANAVKADAKRIAVQEAVEQFRVEFAADFAWIVAKADGFDFANSMLSALTTYGHLTEKQHAAVIRLRERDDARKVEAQVRVANAPAVDVSVIATAFAHAQAKGIKRPKMVLDGLKFSLAPLTGRNAGALYVVRKDDDQYLGKIMDGRFTRVRDCDDVTEARIIAVASDPHNEAVAYGKRTGECCICSRTLTNHASIDAGIGPICAERFGW